MKKTNSKDFDQTFDEGKDVTKHLKKKTTVKVNQKVKRVNIDFPVWVIETLDLEASRLGVTRQALVKFWVAERLDKQGIS